MTARIAIAHDYITQRGGAERVALVMARTFPGASLTTLLYNPTSTFPEFHRLRVRTSRLDRYSAFRHNHRLALPLLAREASRLTLDADVSLISTSGWAHGMNSTGRKVVYCHAPARWLYQEDRYLAGSDHTISDKARRLSARATLKVLGPSLREWDKRAAESASVYLANSRHTKRAVSEIYGIEAELLLPPPGLTPHGATSELPIAPGYFLIVARLLPYKNILSAIDAVLSLMGSRLVIVGDGPERAAVEERARRSNGRVRLFTSVSDEQLRWIYRNSLALVATSYEDYGLSPLEAASFGRPTVALRAGGYLDTVDEAINGEFFDSISSPEELALALRRASTRHWSAEAIAAHASKYSEEAFCAKLRKVVSHLLCG